MSTWLTLTFCPPQVSHIYFHNLVAPYWIYSLTFKPLRRNNIASTLCDSHSTFVFHLVQNFPLFPMQVSAARSHDRRLKYLRQWRDILPIQVTHIFFRRLVENISTGSNIHPSRRPPAFLPTPHRCYRRISTFLSQYNFDLANINILPTSHCVNTVRQP